MLEQCPVCAAKVLFTTNICPRCQVDRTNPHPSKLVDWRLHNDRVQAEQKAAKAPRKRNIQFSVGGMLIIGGWTAKRFALESSQYIQSMGFRHSPVVGLTIAASMITLGIALLLNSIFKSRS